MLCELAREELLGIHDALPNTSGTSPILLSTKKPQVAIRIEVLKGDGRHKADDVEHITQRVDRDLRRHRETNDLETRPCSTTSTFILDKMITGEILN